LHGLDGRPDTRVAPAATHQHLQTEAVVPANVASRPMPFIRLKRWCDALQPDRQWHGTGRRLDAPSHAVAASK